MMTFGSWKVKGGHIVVPLIFDEIVQVGMAQEHVIVHVETSIGMKSEVPKDVGPTTISVANILPEREERAVFVCDEGCCFLEAPKHDFPSKSLSHYRLKLDNLGYQPVLLGPNWIDGDRVKNLGG
jgi:hypothetical protein